MVCRAAVYRLANIHRTGEGQETDAGQPFGQGRIIRLTESLDDVTATQILEMADRLERDGAI